MIRLGLPTLFPFFARANPRQMRVRLNPRRAGGCGLQSLQIPYLELAKDPTNWLRLLRLSTSQSLTSRIIRTIPWTAPTPTLEG